MITRMTTTHPPEAIWRTIHVRCSSKRRRPAAAQAFPAVKRNQSCRLECMPTVIRYSARDGRETS
eukprot:scaffold21530_cov37-Tisochrysis_lutea.AAC.6